MAYSVQIPFEHQQRNSSISDTYVCWSRMQSEAGQGLSDILQRKENERRAGGGVFFWGVGNAPSRAVSALARLRKNIPVYFSIMKSKPKLADSAPSSVVVWRRYIDHDGAERQLPPFALITSRGSSGSGNEKTKHFALVCRSDEELKLKFGTPFNHHAFRNAGPNGGQIGASQVTALLRPVDSSETAAEYEVNLEASLTGSYWIRLSDPLPLTDSQIALYNSVKAADPAAWMEFASELRHRSSTRADEGPQLGLF
ncbi:hypothetical protein EOS93_14595 [Rhizobium sp. RMa-01]|uniref:hypothetical protein n=1 Tax=unclassified Rhizobium TaxID=2613769 RepID=UPI000FE11528|nr:MULTISPECIES: hypothetical protein [unclassified Rhizobium]RVU10596.1 hypothetical protein EOS93_14595 [Rhizobium sp. RMa-01]